jgi:RNA polymerase sigma-70 factor (ECF subfamily)
MDVTDMSRIRDDRPFEERFEEHRSHLRSVAHRILGSFAEADDAVQETWLRASAADHDAVDNLGGWLTTIVARVSLNQLRSRGRRREDPLEVHVADPVVVRLDVGEPEREAELADAVGLALQVVVEALGPAERLAFVLHDLFAVPFEEIADIVGRSPAATRQLASRARRRVQSAAPVPDVDLDSQRVVVDAFFAAAREGDLAGLVAVLDPDVVLRSDGGPRRPKATALVHGAEAVAARAVQFRQGARWTHPAIVDGVAGVVVAPKGHPVAVMAFTVVGGRIVAIDALNDPDRLALLDLGPL